MNKRLLSVLLAAALLLLCISGVSASSSLWFVAVNDTIPLSYSGDTAPYYSGGNLYIPYTAFNAAPGGVVISNNVDQNTLVLFTRTKRLVYDLNDNSVTDEAGNTDSVTVSYRSGTLFLPASAASHFGLSVSLLTSQSGYTILRFSNGSQVYDDDLFVEKAENLISYMVQQAQEGSASNPPSGGEVSDVPQETEDDPPPEVEPATVYLAFSGDAVSKTTLELLEAYSVRAAFFLTAEQFTLQTDLVRSIYAAGHTVGLTVSGPETDYAAALSNANDAMYSALFCKSIFALVPAEAAGGLTGYCVLPSPETPLTVEEVLAGTDAPQLLLCQSDPTETVQILINAGASLPQLVETTFLS